MTASTAALRSDVEVAAELLDPEEIAETEWEDHLAVWLLDDVTVTNSEEHGFLALAVL